MATKRTFTVILHIGDLSAADFERWSNGNKAVEDIDYRGAGDDSETWRVRARDARSATAKVEREIKRSGIDGITVSSIEERL